jgi:hypothetical protein
MLDPPVGIGGEILAGTIDASAVEEVAGASVNAGRAAVE